MIFNALTEDSDIKWAIILGATKLSLSYQHAAYLALIKNKAITKKFPDVSLPKFMLHVML